ncbi:exonuclease, partial [Glaesserella parasuis]|nr:exonuclease [Glaesserella parasuis]
FIHTAERDPVLMKAFDKYIPQFIETLKAFRM